MDIIVEPANIEQGKQPEPGEEKEVGEEDPGEAEQGGGNKESHPEEDGKGLQPPLEGDRERGELDPQKLHFHLHRSGDESGETVESGELGEELNPKSYIFTFGQLIVQPPAWDRYGFVWEAADKRIKQPTLYFRRV